MQFLSSEQMRLWDRRTIAERGIAGLTLMNRAGAAVAGVVVRLLAVHGGARVVLVAGKGNNGGDALVAARCLQAEGIRTQVLLTCTPDTLRGDALLAMEQLQMAGVPFRVLADGAAWQAFAESDPVLDGVVVDGLLGTGSAGAPQGVVAAAIQWIQQAGRRCAVVAIDLPSGLSADTGEAFIPVVRADVTVTLAAPKTGFAESHAWEYLGHVEAVDIGLPTELCPGASAVQLISAPEVGRIRARRGVASHKGDYGHVLVIGGSHGLCSAPALAAMGALRCGAGLVSAAVPAESLAFMASLAPTAMAHRIATEQGGMTESALAAGIRAAETFDVVLAGPGLSNGPATKKIIDNLLDGAARRLVLDADALNVMAGGLDCFRRAMDGTSVILTPHPGEAARLLGTTVAQVQANRVDAAREMASRSGAIVVLKGAGTLVATPAGAVFLNLTGNPGMATGGTGDVLAGMIAGIWAQGGDPLAAAQLAVYLHGTAGDLAAWRGGTSALSAADLGGWLGAADRWMGAFA